MAAKIKKGDMVLVTAGRDKGERGRVMRVQPERDRVWVEKVNMISRHQKGVAGQTESEIIRKEAPINISNVMMLDPEAKDADGELLPTRVGFKLIYDISDEERQRMADLGQQVKARKVRFAKRSGAILD
jgi:large subunit ribosomal protein L24